MSIQFAEVYDFVRALTGNDDLDLGLEILPNTRLDILLKTSVMTLPNYSAMFPKLLWTNDPTDGLVFYLAGDLLAVVPDEVVQAVVHVAAHKYLLSLGSKHRDEAERTETFIYKCSENLSGQSVETPS